MRIYRYTHLPSLGILVTFLMHISHAAAAPQDQIPFKKLGCFTDTNQGFLIKSLRKDIDINTNITNSCITYCESQGTLFAAVTNHNICTCGVKYDSKKSTSESTCNIQCDNFTCGGPSAATLYQILPKSCHLPKSAGYLEFGESCYRIEKNPMNWDDAERKCVSEKGHLTSVHNSRENYFILSLFTAVVDVDSKTIFPTIWAGGVYHPPSKKFTWADGSMLDFNHWGAGQPSSNSIANMCLNMGLDETNGSWFVIFCTFAHPFVCKRLIEDSIDTSPHVYQVRSGATTTCIPINADKFLNNSATVIALYPLMVGDVTGVTVQGRASTPVTTTYIHYNIKSNPDTKTNPIFVTDSTRNQKVMKFDGTGQLIENAPREPKGSAELSVAAWVNCAKLETAPLEMVIVSKSNSKAKWKGSTLLSSDIKLSWALTIEGGSHYCLQVGAMKYCTVDSAQVTQGVAQHVTAIYFGTRIEIFVNGKHVSVKNTGQGQEASVPDSEHPLVIGGAYQGKAKPGIPDTNFKGELHDVRVYGEALQIVDIDYLYSCSGGVTTDVIHLYEGVTAQLELNGRDLNIDQNVGFSVTPCNGAQIDKRQSPVSMKAKGSFSTDVTIPGAQIRKPSYFYPSNTDVSYDLCIGLQSTPNYYNFSAGVKIMITQLSSVEQHPKSAVVEIIAGKTVDKSIRIGGYGLADGQLITLSPTHNCVSQVTESAITNTNTNGENATVQFRFNAQTTVYYLCWKDKGGTASIGKPTGLAVQFTGPKFSTSIPITINMTDTKCDHANKKTPPKSDVGPTRVSSRKTASIVIGVVSAIVFIVMLVGVVFLYRKYRSERNVSMREGDIDMEISDPLAPSRTKQLIVPIEKINKDWCQSPTPSHRYSDLSNDDEENTSHSVDDL